MSKSKFVSVIIVNWNGKKVLETCIRSLLKQAYKPIEIIVWDNNSTDSSLLVLEKYPSVRVIRNTKNFGFAEANSLAVKYAKGEYVLLLNNDTVVTNNFLAPLVNDLEKNKRVGVVQPLLLYKGNPLYTDGTVNSAGAYLTPTGFLYYPYYGKDPKRIVKTISEIYSANGACMLIRKSLINRIGLFDEDFFAYYEETDFCVRVLLSGHTILCDTASVVYHRGSVSSAKHPASTILFHSYKNRICSILKSFDTYTLISLFPLHILLTGFMSFLYMSTGKFLHAYAVIRAYLWNIQHASKTFTKRKYIQYEIRKLSDDTYLKNTMRSPDWKYYLYLILGLDKYEDPLLAIQPNH